MAVGVGDQTFYRGKDNKMQMIYFSIPNNKLEHAYLNQNGQKVEGDIVVGDGNQLFYRGNNGHLWTYYWQNGSWHNHQLSNNSNQKVKNACGSIAIGANNQVFYRGTDDELHTYYFDNGNWYHGLMGNPNSSIDNIKGDIVVDKNNNNRVLYVASTGSGGGTNTYGFLRYFEYINGAWVLSSPSSNIFIREDCGSLTLGNNSQIFYVDPNDDLHTAEFDGTNWTSTLLIPDAVSTTSNIVATKGNHNQVMYRGKYGGAMNVFYEDAVNGWSFDWLETSSQAPSVHNPEGSIYMTDADHIYYRSNDLGLLYRYHWADDFNKSGNSNINYFSMEETPLSPTIPKLENVGNILNIIVRPNPVESDFVVDIYAAKKKEIAQITIYDNMGRPVLFQETVLFEGRNSVKLNIASLQSGMYYLKVMDSEGRFLSKTIMKL
jgi:hypothetical protein